MEPAVDGIWYRLAPPRAQSLTVSANFDRRSKAIRIFFMGDCSSELPIYGLLDNRADGS